MIDVLLTGILKNLMLKRLFTINYLFTVSSDPSSLRITIKSSACLCFDMFAFDFWVGLSFCSSSSQETSSVGSWLSHPFRRKSPSHPPEAQHLSEWSMLWFLSQGTVSTEQDMGTIHWYSFQWASFYILYHFTLFFMFFFTIPCQSNRSLCTLGF